MSSDAILNYDIFAHDRGASSTFKKVGLAAEGTTKSFKTTDDAAGHLTRRMADAKQNLANLQKEFAQTGDIALLKQITKGERDVKNLTGWLRHLGVELDDVSKKGDDGGRKVGFLSRQAEGAGMALSRAFPTGSAFFNPVILGATAAVGAIALIPAAALTAGVATAGIGLGFIAAAAYAVRGSKSVQTSAKDMGDAWTSEVTKAGAGTEKHFIRSLNILKGTAADTGPTLKRIFDNVTPSTVNLAHGIDGLVNNSLPGLEDASEGAAIVLDRMALKLPDLGTAVSDFGTHMKDSADGGATALNAAVGLVVNQLGLLGAGLEYGSKGLEYFSNGAGRFAGGVAGGLVAYLSGTGDAAKDTGDKMDGLRIDVESTAVAFDKLKNAQLGEVLSLAGAQTAASEARRQLGEALEKEGKSFQLGTEIGNKHRTMLEGAAVQAGNLRKQTEETAIAQGRASTATQEGATAYGNYVFGLAATLRAAKLTDGQIHALLVSFGLLPESVETSVTTPGAKPSKTDVQMLKEKIDALEDKQVIAAAKADYREVLRLRIQMDALRDKMVRISVNTHYSSSGQIGGYNYVDPGRIRKDKSRWGNIYSFAGGGVQAKMAGPGTLYQWAEPETGGEAFIPRRGDATRSRDILAQAAAWYGGQVVYGGMGNAAGMAATARGAGGLSIGTVTVNVPPGASGADAARQFIDVLMKYRKDNGLLPWERNR